MSNSPTYVGTTSVFTNGQSFHSSGPNGDSGNAKKVPPKTIEKRDGRIVTFDPSRIEMAITRCFNSLSERPDISPAELTSRVVNIVAGKYPQPTVERVQDIVEEQLMAVEAFEAAKHYIVYRHEHERLRQQSPIPDDVRNAFLESEQYFPTEIQKFQFYDKYARFNHDMGRRETWVEAVDRSVEYLRELSKGRLAPDMYLRVRTAILEMQAMPSLRLLSMAGPAARRNNISIYGCSYMPVDSPDAFVEALLISMNGCGVGYSVERRYVEKLPKVRLQKGRTPKPFVVEDTTEGWADALRAGLVSWFDGEDIHYDFSLIRPAGRPLRTKGGRASGPEPLRWSLEKVRSLILSQQGSSLRTIDCHDLMCWVGNAAVSGGVRRTAMIALFDIDDKKMRNCKKGDKLKGNEQRYNANNSVVWPDRELTQAEITKYFLGMNASMRGEPGIFSRRAAMSSLPDRRFPAEFGTNPCGEIILRPWQFCNLSIAVARPDDNFDSIKDKVEIATILGTIQSMATHFPGLRPIWRENCEEERLLGVDITGQMDSPIVRDPEILAVLRQVAIQTNRQVAEQLGINPSAAITCNKPSGNSSVMLDCSPGIQPRHSSYYIRNVRVSTHTPVFKVLRDAGVPMDPENGYAPEAAPTWVAHFPVKAPRNAITRKDLSALDQCENWLKNKVHWAEHNPSVTINYDPREELIDLIEWVWRHQDMVGGMTFYPRDDALYEQPPYVEITESEYDGLATGFPAIDFSKLYRYEQEDFTTSAQEVSCSAGICERQL